MQPENSPSEETGGFAAVSTEQRAAPAPVSANPPQPGPVQGTQLRGIQVLYNNFLRSLSTGLSAYLRSRLRIDLTSMQQVTYAEFVASLSSPTYMVALGLRPYPGSAVLELSPSFVFPMLELLLGSKSSGETLLHREITEIEQSVLNEILQILQLELREAFSKVDAIEFVIESVEKDPHISQILLWDEPVAVLSAEARFGKAAGSMKLAIPVLAVRRMEGILAQHRSSAGNEESSPERDNILQVLLQARVSLDVCLRGSTILFADLLELREGQVLTFAQAADQDLDGLLNGLPVYKGQVVASGSKLSFRVAKCRPPGWQGG